MKSYQQKRIKKSFKMVAKQRKAKNKLKCKTNCQTIIKIPKQKFRRLRDSCTTLQ